MCPASKLCTRYWTNRRDKDRDRQSIYCILDDSNISRGIPVSSRMPWTFEPDHEQHSSADSWCSCCWEARRRPSTLYCTAGISGLLNFYMSRCRILIGMYCLSEDRGRASNPSTGLLLIPCTLCKLRGRCSTTHFYPDIWTDRYNYLDSKFLSDHRSYRFWDRLYTLGNLCGIAHRVGWHYLDTHCLDKTISSQLCLLVHICHSSRYTMAPVCSCPDRMCNCRLSCGTSCTVPDICRNLENLNSQAHNSLLCNYNLELYFLETGPGILSKNH